MKYRHHVGYVSRMRGGKHYDQGQSLKKFIRERDNYTCRLCGKEGWIIDHIIPWRISHDSTIGNLRVVCHACNVATRRERQRKPGVGLPLDEWYAWLEKWANQT